jgi:dihydroflavonol-4-reductase
VPGLRLPTGVVRSPGVTVRTAFVTGATGFLGLNVVDALLAEGWRVTALHRAESKVSRLRDRGLSLAQGSLEDRAALERAIPEGCDAVFHVAGNVSMWSKRDAEQTRDNVEGTKNVAAAALLKGARRLVHTSTVAVWGRQPRVPFDETAAKNGATSKMNYARSKLRGEDEVRAAIDRGLDAVIMNPCHIVGPYDVNGWSKLIALVAEGKLPAVPPGRGSFCDAGAVARAHVAAVTRGRTGENYLLGGPEATYTEVVSTIGELTEKRAPTRVVPRWVLRALAAVGGVTSRVTRGEPAVTPEMVEGLVHEEVVDSSKAVRELGYETIALRAMLEHALAWQVAEGIVAPPAARGGAATPASGRSG